MTENDYIAEYVKEFYPHILGFEFVIWKSKMMLINALQYIGEAFSKMSKEEVREIIERSMKEDEDEE